MENSFIGHLELANEPIKPLLPITIFSTIKRESRNYIAYIDTGATYTAISKKVVDDLSFVSDGERLISTAGNEVVKMPIVTVKFRIEGTDDTVLEDSISATVLSGQLNGCEVLIGLDILQRADFHYNGERRIFSISFT